MADPKTTIPRWIDVRQKASEGDALTPLERFILDNEPPGKAEDQWRASLACAIEWVKQQ